MFLNKFGRVFVHIILAYAGKFSQSEQHQGRQNSNGEPEGRIGFFIS